MLTEKEIKKITGFNCDIISKLTIIADKILNSSIEVNGNQLCEIEYYRKAILLILEACDNINQYGADLIDK
jgi:uncharacterized protein YkuJ